MAFKIVSKADPEGVSSGELATINSALAAKADITTVNSALATKADTGALSAKANLTGATFTGQVNVVSATGAGTASVRQIIISTSDPSSGAGSNGDIWFKYQA